ncbi:MAG: nucleotide-binding universal stress UspA family protein [Hyphomicrobiaceae bacterium]|jgi:nucleotide-binding universal stress UspA family protein
MYSRILVSTDGSELASKAVRSGLELAKSLNANVILLTVTERWPLVETAAQAEMGVKDPVGTYEILAQKGARSTLDAAAEIAIEIGIECEQIHVRDQHPSGGILDTAEKQGVDLIVIASHGRRGLSKMLLGSVANEVVAQSTVPVLVVR